MTEQSGSPTPSEVRRVPLASSGASSHETWRSADLPLYMIVIDMMIIIIAIIVMANINKCKQHYSAISAQIPIVRSRAPVTARGSMRCNRSNLFPPEGCRYPLG